MSEQQLRVLVAGAGAMGSQIAMVTALAGHHVHLYDVSADALAAAVETLRGRMSAQVAKGRRTEEDVADAFDRLTTYDDLDVAAAEADLVIEAIVEKLEVKREFFARVAALVSEQAILASNSSSFVPSSMASAVPHPERFCNIHFFNPALIMKCVEIVRGPNTSPETMQRAGGFVEGLGKTVVVLDKEIPGFVANRILNAVRDEAIRLLEGGYADVEGIDTACRTALGYPMGPFELMDLTGIDIGYLTKSARYAETHDPADAPSRTVSAKYEAGDLGRKTGRGFYVYDASGTKLGVAPLPAAPAS